MFTGLIKDIGTVKSITSNAEGKEFVIQTNKLYSEINIDDSIATNGVCLTATALDNADKTFKVQAVHVTLEKTNIGKLKIGSSVNLELALRPMDRLGGHFVQGHVNGIGKIKKIVPRGKNYEIELTAPQGLFKYMIPEGSISLDGISLTISKLTSGSFSVSIIPHTYQNTVLHTKSIGETVNIEVDMMAKYLENFFKFNKKDSNFSLDDWYKEQN